MGQSITWASFCLMGSQSKLPSFSSSRFTDADSFRSYLETLTIMPPLPCFIMGIKQLSKILYIYHGNLDWVEWGKKASYLSHLKKRDFIDVNIALLISPSRSHLTLFLWVLMSCFSKSCFETLPLPMESGSTQVTREIYVLSEGSWNTLWADVKRAPVPTPKS